MMSPGIRHLLPWALFAIVTAVTMSPSFAQFVEDVDVIHEIHGEAAGDQFGWIARRVPDADGDGIFDFCASAPMKTLAGEQNCGRIYVYSGRTGVLMWQADGAPGAFLGINIKSAGDVNGDGAGDVIAGAPGANAAYVYSGKDGEVLLTLVGDRPGVSYGRTVSPAGDVDRDGRDDLLIGSPRYPDADTATGRVYLVSGKDGTTLRTLDGEGAGHLFGSTLNGFSDDEHSFLIIGAQNAGDAQRGRVYVFDGRTGEKKFTVEARETGKNLGRMFASMVGDVDADGVPDLYCSDWEDDTNHDGAGRIYVCSGRDGTLLFTKHGEAAGDGFGIGNGDAGDVNGDGHDDLIIGAWQQASGAAGGGRCYLIDGRNGGIMRMFTSDVENETFGFDTTNLGDVDGDGAIDLLITSAWSGVKGEKSGRIWVVSSGLNEPDVVGRASSGAGSGTPATIYYHHPAWSPDGRTIAFYTNRDGNFEIYTVRDDGTDLRRLTHNDSGDTEMAWSPDGTRLVFSSNRDGPGALYVMDADGSNPSRLTDRRLTGPVWSPDGTKIACEGRLDDNRDLYVIDADGSSVTRLTTHEANDFRPTWSPDGARIVFSSKRSGSYGLYVMGADGTDIRELVDSDAHEVSPAWSPDGKTLLFTRIADDSYLCLLDFESEQQNRLIAVADVDNMVSWSPDGTRIAYITKDAAGLGIFTMSADGTNSVRLVPRR